MSKADDALLRARDGWKGWGPSQCKQDADALAQELLRVRAATVQITAEDLTPAIQRLYDETVPEALRDAFDANKQREIKQEMLDSVWPAMEVLIELANLRLSAALGREHVPAIQADGTSW